jgi:hypothetical protein
MSTEGMGDYSALAQRVSTGISGIRGCLMLSRDGMVLGAEPGDGESDLRADWVRFAALGDPERSYVEFPDRTWAFVRRGGYAAFAVADTDVRPGVLVDLLDQALMAGEQERARDRDTMRLPDAPVAKSGKPRTKMHKSERPVPPESVEPDPASAPAEQVPRAGAETDPSPEALPAPKAEEQRSAPDPGRDEGHPDAVADGRGEGGTGGAPSAHRDDPEVDRILLAKEFAGLLQVSREDDEASG